MSSYLIIRDRNNPSNSVEGTVINSVNPGLLSLYGTNPYTATTSFTDIYYFPTGIDSSNINFLLYYVTPGATINSGNVRFYVILNRIV